VEAARFAGTVKKLAARVQRTMLHIAANAVAALALLQFLVHPYREFLSISYIICT